MISDIVNALQSYSELIKPTLLASKRGLLATADIKEEVILQSNTNMGLLSSRLLTKVAFSMAGGELRKNHCDRSKKEDSALQHKLFYYMVGASPDTKVHTLDLASFVR